MKFAYLILAHKNPGQLAMLCRTLTSLGGTAYVHVDAKSDLAAFQEALSQVQRTHLLDKRWPIYWGGFNMIEATLHMCRLALQDGADRLVLLSGLDFPIQPMREVEGTLGQDLDHIDMLALPCPGLGDGDGYHRIRYFYGMDLMGQLGLKPRTLFTLHSRLLPFLHRRVPSGLNIRMGSQWWCLRAETVRTILSVLEQRPDIVRFFRWSSIPDESFFHSLVFTHKPEKIHPHCLRLIVWNREPKPYVFKAADMPELLASDALFARKFDQAVDPKVLDLVLAHTAP